MKTQSIKVTGASKDPHLRELELANARLSAAIEDASEVVSRLSLLNGNILNTMTNIYFLDEAPDPKKVDKVTDALEKATSGLLKFVNSTYPKVLNNIEKTAKDAAAKR